MELGKLTPLYVVKKTPMGVFLNDDPEELLNSVMLPKEDMAALTEKGSLALGDVVKAYLYRGHDNKLAVTTKAPLVANGDVGVLECVASNRFGAFLDWGMEKDVLLPFNEQLTEVKKGHKVLVGLYTDKSGRLCATQKIKKFLKPDCPYGMDDVVSGVIYDIAEEIGAFVAVEGGYYGLVLSNEVMPHMAVGQKVTGRITKVRPDGKVNLTLNKRIDRQMDEDSEKIFESLRENDGFLPYHDKTEAETIRRVFNMSKKAFKRSIGLLYREKKIEIKEDGIYLISEGMGDA